MEKLVSDCDPATFGVGNEDRLDVEYRSAWKLDNSKFASSFHPFDSDMMEVVKQLLFSGAVHLGVNEPVIVAELYKLNVLSLFTNISNVRFTKVLMINSSLMWTLRGGKINSDLWSFVFRVPIRAANSLFVTMVAKLHSIGAMILNQFNGLLSTVIVNMKSCQ